MSKKPHIPPSPPRWVTRLLEWYCKPSLYEDLQGDLLEYFDRNVERRGAAYAKLIYVVDVIKFFRSYTVQKPQIFKRMDQFVMFGNYFKTSVRSMSRNKLFTAINVTGLAVSMSVGLLMIAIIYDLNSYDDFQENKDRIFRIISHDERVNQPSMTLASTSVKAGKRIGESIPGVEQLTMLRREFRADATVGGKTLPFRALWASETFFKVFSFNLLQGSQDVALKEPYSIVLTETAAHKFFGETDVVGEIMTFDSLNYMVTGVMQDVPEKSHIRFEALVSFATVELEKPSFDGGFMDWGNVFSNYVYVLLPKKGNLSGFQAALTALSEEENKELKNRRVFLRAQPISEIVVDENLSNPIGPTIHKLTVWVLTGLALVVVLSACFNYTNLSIARALRRSKEVGVRKVMGAQKSQVRGQFMMESVIIALLALIFSFPLFLLLRIQFMEIYPHLADMVDLQLSPGLALYFLMAAVAVGMVSGFLPATVFARINPIKALKDATSLRLLRHMNMRRILIVAQYTISLIFITATLIGVKQYKGFLALDLGFNTEQILNIPLQGNNSELLINELSAIPEVAQVSQSRIVTGTGSIYGDRMKYYEPVDSAIVWLNYVDENYLLIHGHQFLAGDNFQAKTGGHETDVIVNEKLLQRFSIARNPVEALGKQIVSSDGTRLTIIGVLKDFIYGTVENPIEPVAFRFSSNETGGFLNVKLRGDNLPATLARIEKIWDKVDEVHAFSATFYDDQIEQNYKGFLVMTKVIGFLAFLAVCISSMGLFGMVVFTSEIRLREIGIRKVMGASERSLVFLLARGFLVLLLVSGMIALPLTWAFFEKVVLINFVYHEPIGWIELSAGMLLIMGLALMMIASQTYKAARINPAHILRNE